MSCMAAWLFLQSVIKTGVNAFFNKAKKMMKNNKMPDIDSIIQAMSLEQKASLCSGLDFWHTKPLTIKMSRGNGDVSVHSIMMCDGPNGLRKQEGESDHLGLYGSIESICSPQRRRWHPHLTGTF